MNFKREISNLLKKELNEDVESLIEVPKDSSLGDYAFPCFILAKKLHRNPLEIARELSNKIKSNILEKIEAKGPYLNFFINKSKLNEFIIKEILLKKEKYGSTNLGKNKKFLIEHTSINPNASPHVGRARNALIGDSLVRLFRFQGYKTEVHYYINDVGKQIAMLVLGCKGKPSFDKLLNIYVKINKKVQSNPEKEKEIFSLLNRLEKRDKNIVKRFKEIVNICIKGQSNILSELGIKYDFFDYESKYLWNKETENILKALEKTGKVFTDESNRKILDLKEFNLPMKTSLLVLTRGDGTSLYGLRDIAYNIEKIKRSDKNAVILGEDQKLYFMQIKSALSLLGYKAPEVIHYSFILLQKGKMSTRSGNVVLLEDFMKEALKKAIEEIKKRKKGSLKNAKAIGYGSIKYSILRVSPEKNVIFDWDSALNFEGESAPYIQYAHARACSILKKSKPKKPDLSLLKTDSEIKLIKKLGEFPGVINNAINSLRPSSICSYLFELAKAFTTFYHDCPVLKTGKGLKEARLSLVLAAKVVINAGLNILGIEAPESM